MMFPHMNESYSKMCKMGTNPSQVVPVVATVPFETAGSQYETTERILRVTRHVVFSRYSFILVYQCNTELNRHRHEHEYMYEYIYMHTQLRDLSDDLLLQKKFRI